MTSELIFMGRIIEIFNLIGLMLFIIILMVSKIFEKKYKLFVEIIMCIWISLYILVASGILVFLHYV